MKKTRMLGHSDIEITAIGYGCIPGSYNEQHIIEDYDVWDFELTEEEMAQMTALERDDRFADY